MGVLTRAAKKRRLEEEEEQGEEVEEQGEEVERRLEDHISRLLDEVLGEIVSLLPTKDGGRTQVLSSRWRPIWRAAPLNVDLDFHVGGGAAISRLLSSHHGPVRRFAVRAVHGERTDHVAVTVDGWLRSPALDNLEDLEFHLGDPTWGIPALPPPLPASARRFSSTLRAASFGGCSFPDGGAGGEIHLPLLKQLTLFKVRISERSLLALLAGGCPVLQSLLLLDIKVNLSNRVQIRSSTLRSIGVRSDYSMGRLYKLVIEDAPCLERFMFFRGNRMDISVISAPRLGVLGLLSNNLPWFSFGTTRFQLTQGSGVGCLMTTVGCNVKVLAIPYVKLNLGMAIELMKCFPNLEKLYIKTGCAEKGSVWRVKYRNLIQTLDIRLKKIVLADYRGDKSRINFVKFFISNARALESMTLELAYRDASSKWIEKQHRMMLQIRKRASRGVRFDFVSRNMSIESLSNLHANELAHDLSTTDPFERFP
ncbi:unnamed protein product [Urochloa decumbens]|uniref:FBD domain-containing protein n=1 Tax=Urochloa decumbens TaxID=240449 RepID=A0ABC9GC98_9POAL